MDLQQYIEHPETLSRETLYELRALTARHPYYQPARLLLLKNLFLLHDSSFDEELRRASVCITDRKKLFELVEGAHYKLNEKTANEQADNESTTDRQTYDGSDRTAKLIDDFLNQIPKDESQSEGKRKPTAADATVDYVAYLLENESGEQKKEEADGSPQMKGQELIDDFLLNDDGKMQLQEEPEYEPDTEETTDNAESEDSGYFTETLARIYIKQGRYSKALEIIKRLNLIYPKKNRYFADQIRFLEKLIINNNKNKE